MANAKYKIKGKKIKDYDDPDIEVEVDDKYEAYSKNIPENKTPYKTFEITWFNNFGIRDIKTNEDANVEYKAKLKELPEGKSLFALYKDSPSDSEPKVHELSTENDGNGNIKFNLNVGDPPIGMGP